MLIRFSTLLLVFTHSVVQGQRGQGNGPGMGNGMGNGQGMGGPPADQAIIQNLLSSRDEIERDVMITDDSVISVTTSENPQVASWLQQHVEAMTNRMKNGNRIRQWDEFFVNLFDIADDLETEVAYLQEDDGTPLGVHFVQRAATLCAWYVAKDHATVVTGFVERGEEEAQKNHAVPRVCSEGLCFSGHTTVQVQDKGWIPIKDLHVGDLIRVPGDRFEPVYSFGHWDAEKWSEFLILNEKLEVSPAHLVAVEKRGFVPSSTVKLGDRLLSSSGAAIEVKSIDKITRKGVYAPFTPSGMLVVGDFVASSFVSLQPDSAVLKIGGLSTGLSFQWLEHTFEFPHRLVCHHWGSC